MNTHQTAEKQGGDAAVEGSDKGKQACLYPSVITWWTVESREGLSETERAHGFIVKSYIPTVGLCFCTESKQILHHTFMRLRSSCAGFFFSA